MKVLLAVLLNICIVYGGLCPDRVHRCPSWAVCCQNRDLTYGCCPYNHGECCPDFIHCCPQGTHCNVTTRSCDSNKVNAIQFEWMIPHYHPDVLSSAFGLEEEVVSEGSAGGEVEMFRDVKNNNCPDNSTCPDSATCCLTLDGEYSCCPFANGTCCKDEVHCCPSGYDCDITNMQCKKKAKLVEKLEKVEVLNRNKNSILHSEVNSRWNKIFEEDSLVICPNKIESCPPRHTCCAIPSGQYGCCNETLAFCCEDKLTCCPLGFICGDRECERLPSFQLSHLQIFTPKINLVRAFV